MGVVDFAAGETPVLAKLNTLADEAREICTSTSRPGSPREGQGIFETDTQMSLTWINNRWRYDSGGLLPYASPISAPQTSPGTDVFLPGCQVAMVVAGNTSLQFVVNATFDFNHATNDVTSVGDLRLFAAGIDTGLGTSQAIFSGPGRCTVTRRWLVPVRPTTTTTYSLRLRATFGGAVSEHTTITVELARDPNA
jgi:hypothetical protein